MGTKLIFTATSSDYEAASLLFIDLSPEFETLPTFKGFLLKAPQDHQPDLRKLRGMVCPDYENMVWAPFGIDGRSIQLTVYESWYLYYNQASIDYYLSKFLTEHDEVRQYISTINNNVDNSPDKAPPQISAPPLGWHVPMNQMISTWLYLLRPLSHPGPPIPPSVSSSTASSPYDISSLVLDRWDVPPLSQSQHDDRLSTLKYRPQTPLMSSTPMTNNLVIKSPTSPSPELALHRCLSRYLHLLDVAHIMEYPRTPITVHPSVSYSSIDTQPSRPVTAAASTKSRSSFRAHTRAWTSAVASRILSKFHRREKVVAPSPEIPFDSRSWHSFYDD